MSKKDITKRDADIPAAFAQYVQHPGDKMTTEVTPHGDIVTKLSTSTRKATHRQYVKKDGTKGKQTITIMQP